MRIACKATVHIGEFARGGMTRGDHQACDHDCGCREQYIPWGIVDEDSGELQITFGSSYKTSDCIVDTLEAKWQAMDAPAQAAVELLQSKMANGPESSGVRPQCLHRRVQCADHIGTPMQ